MNTGHSPLYTLLRRSEAFFKTDMVYLFKGGFWGTVSQVGLVLMAFGVATAFAHFVPKETYGQYKYILSIVNLLGTVTLTGLGTAVLQSISRGYEGTLLYAFWKNLRWSALFFIGAGIISVYYFVQGNSTLGISMLVAGCLWPFFNSTNLYGSLLVAKKDFRRVTLYFDLIGNIVPYAAIFVTMFCTTNPLWFVLVYIISNTLIGLILFLRILAIYKPNKNVDTEMLGYSKHLSAMGILGGIADNIDQILVFHYIGAAQLALYNFATAIPDQIKSPMKTLTNMMFPKFTERTDKEIRMSMNSKLLILLIISVLLIISYVLIAPFIFHTFFPKYSDSILYSQIFSISLLFIVGIPTNTYLTARKKIKEQYIMNVSISILQIIVLFVSIITWGLLGLVLTRVFIRLISALASIILYNTSREPSESIASNQS